MNKIDQATEEDKACGLDHWARLFRATTWEELRRLAGNNEVLNGMIVTMAKLSEDDKIRMQCEAREIYNRRERTWQVTLEEETARADKAEQQLKNEKARADNAEAEIASLQKRLRELQK